VSQQDPRIAERYAARPSRWPRVFVALGLGLAGLLAAWLAWAVWVHSTPEVSSNLLTWKVVDEHTATARLDVSLREGTSQASCLLRAYAEDHTVVGDASFTPHDGVNEVSVRTERLATSVEKVGCTTAGQNDAR
jgi:hypothetical protein